MAGSSGGDYYANPITGTIQQQHNHLLADGMKLAGWGGPFPSLAAAHTWLDSQAAQKLKSAAGQAGHDTIAPVEGTTQALAKIGGFFESLTEASTWRSVGWIVVGIILIISGLSLWIRGATDAPMIIPLPV